MSKPTFLLGLVVGMGQNRPWVDARHAEVEVQPGGKVSVLPSENIRLQPAGQADAAELEALSPDGQVAYTVGSTGAEDALGAKGVVEAEVRGADSPAKLRPPDAYVAGAGDGAAREPTEVADMQAGQRAEVADRTVGDGAADGRPEEPPAAAADTKQVRPTDPPPRKKKPREQVKPDISLMADSVKTRPVSSGDGPLEVGTEAVPTALDESRNVLSVELSVSMERTFLWAVLAFLAVLLLALMLCVCWCHGRETLCCQRRERPQPAPPRKSMVLLDDDLKQRRFPISQEKSPPSSSSTDGTLDGDADRAPGYSQQEALHDSGASRQASSQQRSR